MIGLYNIYIPVCGLFISALCNIIFFSRDRVKNKETAIFARVLIYSLIDCIAMTTIIYLGLFHKNLFLIKLLNKIDYGMYILWSSNFFLYIYYITTKDLEKSKARFYYFFFWVTTIIDIIIAILLLILPVYIHNDGIVMYSDGPALTCVLVACALYFVGIVICLIVGRKNIFSKKLTPLYALVVLIAFTGVLNSVDKTIVVVSAVLAYINLIMYFTIENPDIRMIEQLNIARDQADRANHAKSEFLSSMSHEIRTPLNAIVGFSQALQEEDLPAQAQEEVKDIVRASESLLELVNGILDISKIEANKIEIVDTEYNIYEILNDLVALTKARMGSKPLEFKTVFAQDIPQVLYGDPVRVKQIILNLLTNAVKYTKEGEVIFRVSSIHNNEVCRLIISVEDTGIGIKKENIDKLFDKFQRLDIEKNITIEGTGLGMAITKKLIDLMHGRIMVQSVYGKGSKFTVALDQKIIHKVVETKVEEVKPVTDEVADLSGKKILIVDDNKLNLKVASRLIEKYQCDIETCESGIQCLEKINAGDKYDLILMDDMMPEMGGVETFHKLKEIEGFNTPVIALTANAISGMKEKYLSEGFNDYLSKPIDKAELNKILQMYLGEN